MRLHKVLLPILLLLPLAFTLSDAKPGGGEAPWAEGGWRGSFALPRPSLPGQDTDLACSSRVATDVRLRIHRVLDPSAFLRQVLAKGPEEPALEGARAALDPLDVLREAILWGGRRAFVTVHRTSTRALRDVARQTDRLAAPRTPASEPRLGDALPLEGRKELVLVAELVPEVIEDTRREPQTGGEVDPAWENLPGRIRLPGQPAGLYVIELLKESEAAYVPWLVTDLAALAEQDGRTLRVQALSARDGSPATGPVEGTVLEGSQARPLTFNGGGIGELAAGPGVKRAVFVRSGASLAILSSEGMARAEVHQRLYAFTERPLYRPSQEVNLKAILRQVREGENRVGQAPPDLPYAVLDPEDTKVTEGRAKLLNAATATYGATVALPGAGRLGLYRVVFQGPEGPAQAEFKVEQFVKPAFAVSVKTPAAKVGLGDRLEFTVDARYFYGAAVRGAKVEWFLYQVRPSLNWFDENAGPAPELKESGEAELSEDGTVVLPAFPASEEGLWRMVVAVTDASGQRNSGASQVRCSEGDLVLFLSPDRELVSPGQPFTASVKVRDLDGNEMKGVPVTIKACTIRFTQRGKEQGTSDRWAWSYQHRPGEVLAQGKGPSATLRFPKAGLHLLVAEAKDRQGRTIEALRPITVAEEGTPLPAVPDMKALADRREYQPGDTARILVRLPKPKLTLHWSVEGETLGHRSSKLVQGTSTVVEIPVTAALQPNAWIVFQIVADGTRQMAEVPLRVPLSGQKLQVSVQPDKDRYQPGETMRLAVEVRDAKGAPAAADLAVGVVDEAIYALSGELHPDLFRFFHPSRRHLVQRSGSTDWTFYDLFRRQRPVWSLKQTRRGEFKADDADKIRKNFKDTAAWVPFLVAGADGKAATELVLPDNLTAWRVTATAVTPDTKVGVGRSSRPASKPLQVSLTLPRTLSRGEVARAIAMVRNLSGGTLSGKVRLSIQGGLLEGAPEAAFTGIPDQGEYRFALPLRADQVGRLTVTARVEGGGLKDGEQQHVEVVEPLVPASVSGFLQVKGESVSRTIPVPPGARGDATLVLTPVAGLEQLMLPSLPYLIQYPYGCVEQTLSSFMPNVRIAEMIKRKQAPEVEWKKLTDLDRNIRDGVFRVYAYQLPNGGWGWWSPKDFGPQSNPHTTGYALQSLAAMKRLGYAVDEQVLRRGRSAAVQLFQELAALADGGEGRKTWPDPSADAAFVLLSLARTGEPVSGMLDSAADKVLSGAWKGDHVLALAALAAVETKHAKAGALLTRLEQRAQQRSGLVWWEGTQEQWWSYVSGDVVPTTYALMALLQSKPQSPLAAGAEAFLASRHRGYGWHSTWSTSQVLELIPLLGKARPLNWEGTPIRAEIQGGPTFDFRTLKRDPYQNWRSRDPRPGSFRMDQPQAVTVKAEGQGLLLWTYAYQVPGGAAPPVGQAAASGLRLELKRSLWALRTPQQTKDPARGWIRQPWTGSLAVGDEAWMELELKTSKFSPYAMLEVPIPAGLEPTVKLEGFVLEGHPFAEEDAADGAAEWEEGGLRFDRPRIEVHPDKVSFLFSSLDTWRTTRVRILLRAAMAGTYTIRPAKVSLMGNESQWVTCDGLPLTVREGGAK